MLSLYLSQLNNFRASGNGRRSPQHLAEQLKPFVSDEVTCDKLYCVLVVVF